MPKILFMGTPDFAVTILEGLLTVDEIDVIGVVTQPDRPVGRKRQLTPPPIKVLAEREGINIYQPEYVKNCQIIEELIKNREVDLIITAAYGQMLPSSWLSIPEFGAINVHASLLPKYRGGAPVHYAIWRGEKETGVTIMTMAPKMDAGDILAQKKVAITDDTIVSDLFKTLAQVGASLLKETLPKILALEITGQVQDESQVSYAPTIKREEEQINWQEEAEVISRQVRAMNSWPVAHTFYQGERWKIWLAKALEDEKTDAVPGTIIEISKKPAALHVACGGGTVLAVEEIQPNGKKQMPIAAFINGGAGKLSIGDRFDG